MKKEEALKKLNESDSAEFEVFGSDEHKTYLENYKKSEVDPLVANALKDVHNKYDEQMYELFGERKAGDEKTYNFLNRKVIDLKEQNKSAEPLKVKIKELEKAIKDNTGDERLRIELDTVRGEYKKEKDSWEAEKTEHSKSLDTYKLGNELDKAMIGFEFKKEFPQTVTDTFIAQVKSELQKSARMVENVMIFVDESGKTLVNKDNALNPYTAKELLSQRLEGILAKSQKVDGPIKPKREVKDGKEITTLPNPGAKTKMEVTSYLKKNGIPQGSEDYNRMYEEYGRGLPLQ